MRHIQNGPDMQGIKRRVVYLVFYEGFAICATSIGLVVGTDSDLGHSAALAVFTSVVAVLWNLVFNTAFERWEARQVVRGRNLARRIAHAIGFEGGLVVMLVPAFIVWLDIGLWPALTLDLGLSAFFLVYTFAYTWCFDRLFGLPTSAASTASAAPPGPPAPAATAAATASTRS